MELIKQFNEMETFLSISKHLKTILSKFDNIDTVDRNDLYDLVYCKKKLSQLIEQGINNKDLEEDSKDLIIRVDTLLEAFTESQLCEIEERKVKDIASLNKSKYGTKNKFNKLTNSNKTDTKYINSTAKYLRRVAPKIMAMIVFSIVILYLDDIVKIITEELLLNDELLTTENFINIKEDLVIVCKTIVRLASLLVIFILEFSLISDLAFINIPFIRAYMQENNTTDTFISNEAINSLKSEGYIEVAHKVNSNDRYDIAEALLVNSENILKHWVEYVNTYDTDCGASEDTANKIRELSLDAQAIKANIHMSKGSNTKRRLEAYVSAEILYEDLEKVTQQEKEHFDKVFRNLKPICK